jgi:CheY-like chemotaxis protein
MESDHQWSLSVGFEDYMTKPVTVASFQVQLTNVRSGE